MSHVFRLILPLALLAACAGEDGNHPPNEPAREVHPTPPPTESASGTPAPPAGTATLPDVPQGAKVEIVSPKDGDKVKSPVKIVMGVEGMQVKPAGDMTPHSGHHHVIIDAEAVPAGTVVPADEKHLHFGQGQTEAEIELPPGDHTIRIQFADGNHVSYGDALEKKIRITVE